MKIAYVHLVPQCVFSSINGNNRYVEGYFSIYDTASTKLIFVKGF